MNLSRQSKDALCDVEGALSQRTSVSNNLELKKLQLFGSRRKLALLLHSAAALFKDTHHNALLHQTHLYEQTNRKNMCLRLDWWTHSHLKQMVCTTRASLVHLHGRWCVTQGHTLPVWNPSCTIVNLAPLAVSALTRGISVFILRFWYLRICGKGSHFMVLSWSNKYPTLLFQELVYILSCRWRKT